MSLRHFLLLSSALVLKVAAGSCSRVFDLTLTWEPHAPDGHERNMILVNGQFPGPALDITEGQDVEVNVFNELPFNTSVHFHGIEMLNTPWSDGVPGLTQRPIQPGESFSYKWKATQHGSYWYHAHLKGQIEDGLYGPITIHPKKDRQKPFSLISSKAATIHAMEKAAKRPRPVLLSDLRHMTSSEVFDVAVEADMELTCYDSILVNGKGSVQCRKPEEIEALKTEEQSMLLEIFDSELTDKACLPAEVLVGLSGGVGDPSVVPAGVFEGCKPSAGGVESIVFEKCKGDKEQWVALDIIGAFNFITAMVAIDEHSMWVYAVDGDYILPQEVHAIPVTNGDRYSVLVKAKKVGDFSIRISSLAATQILSGRATLSIRTKGAGENENSPSTPHILDNGIPTSPDVVIFNQGEAKPYPPSPIPEKADDFYRLDMRIAGSSLFWAVNNTVLLPADHELEEPLILHPDPHRFDNVTITTKFDTWVDLVFTSNIFPMPPHPMHKHGNKMYLIGSGNGQWEWNSVEEAVAASPESFNLVDPPRRDAFASPNAITEPAWMAVRYHVDNPGPWMLHCHIQNHMMGGMSIIIQDGIDKWPTVPEEYQ